MRKHVRDKLKALVVSALLFAGVGLLFLALLIPAPCTACSMGLWPKPVLYLVGAVLVAAGVIVWGANRPKVIFGLR